MKLQFVQDISIGVGGELAGWHRVGEVVDTRDPLCQWVIDNGWAVEVVGGSETPEELAEVTSKDEVPKKPPAKKVRK